MGRRDAGHEGGVTVSEVTIGARYRGALLGLATGDAVGTTLEFARPGRFQPIDDMVGGGPFHLKPGEWTDDTAMALCLAESLIECGGFDAADQMQRYSRWREEGHLSATGDCFDIGNTVSRALERYQATGEPYSGAVGAHSAGNGALMRLAPIPMRWLSPRRHLLEYAALSCKTTHGAAEAVDACRFYALLIAAALNGVDKDDLLAPDFEPVAELLAEQRLAPAIRRIAQGSYRDREPPDIRGSGYVVHTLEAALWAFHRTGDFREGLLKVVNLGEDADTTGAVYGQLAGAYYGAEAIPPEWRDKLAMADTIETFAVQLLEQAE